MRFSDSHSSGFEPSQTSRGRLRLAIIPRSHPPLASEGPMTNACPSFFLNPAVNRREFLRAGGLGLFGLGLPQLLQARSASSSGPRLAPRAQAKACILLFMWGGPAQQDTWDMKPEAPAVYRGEFDPIATTVPGLRICEHL